ncbi:MAG: PDZ domain-containing protein [Gammaproteobacteria bacterium]|nr:PDZ domain-containing protein [Gammaproteobacteria bacterium]MYH14317.1 PDZ domain-containing protein [Gammaproteobacteria bacterium]MYK84720.1 PDZ domain-containing protein [Gammaproteobacteria bacterium]
MRRFIPIPILLAGLLSTGTTLGAETSAEEQSELQARLDQARQEVEESARRLAEVIEEQMGDNPQAKVGEWFSWDTWLSKDKGAELGVVISDDDQGGVLLMGVSPGSGAEQAGLEPGDRLTTIDGIRLDQGGGRKALLDHMETVEAGQAVALAVLREGATKEVTVVTQPRSARMRDARGALDLDIDLDLDGIEAMGRRVEATDVPRLVDMDADLGAYFGVDQGALVLNAPEDGALKSGDVLLSVGGEPVTSARQARRAIGAAEEPMEAEVMRQKSKLKVSIAPDAFPRHLGKRIRIIKLEEEESP